MPIGSYFQGNGRQVMASMRRARHGDAEAAKREFYATANARHANPADKPQGIGHRIIAMTRKKAGKS